MYARRLFAFVIINILFSLLFINALGYKFNVTYCLVTAALLLSVRNVLSYRLFVITGALVSALYLPVALNYGHPNVNTISSLAYSNSNESTEFLTTIPAWQYLLSITALALAILCIHLKKRTDIVFPPVVILLCLIVIFRMPAISFMQGKTFNPLISHYQPIRFIADTFDAIKELKREDRFYRQYAKAEDNWRSGNSDKYEQVVVVIGESARRDFMSAYGFPLEDTPFMNRSAGILFTNYISAGPATALSLTRTLYYANGNSIEYNNSITQLLKKKGYHTVWISNQGAHGFHDSPIALAGKKADEQHFIKPGTYDNKHFSPDTLLLPFIRQSIARQGKNAIFVHLMGSHPPACYRTQGHFQTFFRNKELSCYVQSIRDTDSLLENIQNSLSASKKSWVLFYFSDHGLLLKDRNSADERLAHGDRYFTNFNIPLFITSSDSVNRITLNARRSAFDFMKILAQQIGINEPKLATRCRLISDENCAPDPMVVLMNGKLIHYGQLAAEPPVKATR